MKSAHLSLVTLSILLMPCLSPAEQKSTRVALDGIEHIQMLGSFDLTITQGEDEYVVLTTDSAVLDKIAAKIQSKKLALGKVDNKWSIFDEDADDFGAHFQVQVRQLSSVSNMGSGKVEIKNILSDKDISLSNMGAGQIDVDTVVADEFEIHNFGSGRLEIHNLTAETLSENALGAGIINYSNVVADEMDIRSSGNSQSKATGNSRVGSLDIRINGSGKVDFTAMEAETAEIDLRGSGDVRVTVKDKLEVELYGSGGVSYGGEPTIEQTIRGSGRVTPLSN